MPSRRLRILQVFNRYQAYGGEEERVFRIGEALQAEYDVENFLSSTAEMTSGGLWKKLTLPLKAAHNPEIAARLKEVQERGRFDLWQIHNVFPVMSPVVYEKALQWNIPIVHYLHNYRLSCVNGFFMEHGKPCQRCLSGNFWPAFETACWHDSHLKSGWMGLITAYMRSLPLFEKVYRWIAISEAQKREHVRMGIPEEKITVIHHFLETDERPLPPAKSPVAMFIGRLSSEKGVAQLLHAWKSVQGGERRLLVVGDGPERANLELQARDLKGVEFVGFAEKEKQRACWEETLFSVVPSIWLEPFGMTVLEAWSRGRPVLGHRIGALPELIRDGENGMLADPADATDLAAKMDLLFCDPTKTQAMGAAGWEDLQTRFSLPVWKAKIRSVYDGLPDR